MQPEKNMKNLLTIVFISKEAVSAACRETHLNGIFVDDNFPCSSVFVFEPKLYLGSREIVKHIY